MKNKPILIINGDLKSIFFEIFFKSIRMKIKTPLILICNKEIFKRELKKNKSKIKYKIITKNDIKKNNFDKNYLNILNIDIIKKSKNISKNKIERKYIQKSFEIAFELIKKGLANKFINGPINKTKFLNKKYPGITEYIAKKFNCKNFGMLIYNKNLSVSPMTTHLPIKMINDKINTKNIEKKIDLINNFFTTIIKSKPVIAVTCLNPHCESVSSINEDKKKVLPAILNMQKKGINVLGPISSDTLFLKNNRKKFNVILGMYHDQVLGPIKTLYEYDAINITMGLPFLRVSPDHGPNTEMVGKNSSNPQSLIKALNFLDKI